MTSFAPTIPDAPVADKDTARTFVETDLDLIRSSVVPVGESVRIAGDGTTATNGGVSGDGISTSSTRVGIVVNPNTSLSGVKVTVSINEDNPGALSLEKTDGTVLDKIDPAQPGTTYELGGNLASSTKYYVIFDDGTTTHVEYNSSAGMPYTSADIDMVDGYDGGEGSQPYTFGSVTAKDASAGTSGTAYTEWPYPDDVYAWDTATFTRTLDTETVDIYIEESSDGGSTWTEIAGPISRGDSIPADPANEVRFRVEISRSDTANNPTLDSISRRWKL